MAKLAFFGDNLIAMAPKRSKVKAEIPFPKLKKYLPSLVQAEERLDFKTGQTIFYEGHHPYGVYVLRKGRIRLVKKSNDGTEKLLKIIEPTQILGEEAFAENRPFEYGAKAETLVSVSFFSRAVIKIDKGESK